MSQVINFMDLSVPSVYHCEISHFSTTGVLFTMAKHGTVKTVNLLDRRKEKALFLGDFIFYLNCFNFY